MLLIRLSLMIAFLCAARLSAGESYTVDADQSVFAVLTQRGGIAARMAHDHLITADGYTASLVVSNGTVSNFTFECQVTKLRVDDPVLKEHWSEPLTRIGILQSPFSEISPTDRETVRDHMLDPDQLDARQFSTIEAAVVSISERENEFHGVTYTHVATLKLTVHGETVTRDVSANITLGESDVVVEAAAAFRFSEFGIKPYSAFFGAVKNLDEFFVYCTLHAKRE